MSIVIEPQTIPLSVNKDGVVRIGNTRVSLDSVIYAFREGASAEEIADRFPTLPLGDVYTVLGYYMTKQAELDEYLAQRRKTADELQSKNEALQKPVGIRDRLLARQKKENGPS